MHKNICLNCGKSTYKTNYINTEYGVYCAECINSLELEEVLAISGCDDTVELLCALGATKEECF